MRQQLDVNARFQHRQGLRDVLEERNRNPQRRYMACLVASQQQLANKDASHTPCGTGYQHCSVLCGGAGEFLCWALEIVVKSIGLRRAGDPGELLPDVIE